MPEMLARAGVKVLLVKEQEKGDGRFPTVKSPNPENGEALAMGIELAKKERETSSWRPIQMEIGWVWLCEIAMGSTS